MSSWQLMGNTLSGADMAMQVSQMSRFVGRKFSSDTEIRSEALRLGYTLEAVADRPHAMTTGGPVDLVQAAAEFLRYVKSVASASSGKPVNNAVISITYPQSNNLRMSEIEVRLSIGFTIFFL
jgi:molecular chaperone DnaK (HSP70)